MALSAPGHLRVLGEEVLGFGANKRFLSDRGEAPQPPSVIPQSLVVRMCPRTHANLSGAHACLITRKSMKSTSVSYHSVSGRRALSGSRSFPPKQEESNRAN